MFLPIPYTTDNINLYNVFVTDFSINKVLSSNWNINTGVKYILNYIINKSFHRFFKDDIGNVNEKFDSVSKAENKSKPFKLTQGKTGCETRSKEFPLTNIDIVLGHNTGYYIKEIQPIIDPRK